MVYSEKQKKIMKLIKTFPDTKSGEFSSGKFARIELSKYQVGNDDWFEMDNRKELIDFILSINPNNDTHEKLQTLNFELDDADIGQLDSFYVRFYNKMTYGEKGSQLYREVIRRFDDLQKADKILTENDGFKEIEDADNYYIAYQNLQSANKAYYEFRQYFYLNGVNPNDEYDNSLEINV